MPSKETLLSLPEVEVLRKLSQSIAMLEAILNPEQDSRYYKFDSKWREGKMMASMSNGSGDEYFILFNAAGAVFKGFDHESTMSPYTNIELNVWPGVLEEVPPEFLQSLLDPAFAIEDIRFCIWRRYMESSWRCGTINYPEENEDSDGSAWLLSLMDGDLTKFCNFVEEYYERSVDIEAVRHVYAYRPLTTEIVTKLNADMSLTALQQDIDQIGYPSQAT